MPVDGDLTASEQAWHALVERFAGLVWSVPRGLGLAPAPALEVAQTAWLRLVEQLDAVPDVGSWLLAAARAESVRAARWHDPAPRPRDEVLGALDELPARTRLAARVLAAGADDPALAAALGVDDVAEVRAATAQRLDEHVGAGGLERVRDAVDRTDPPPPALLAAARAAHSWRTLDAELAPLVEDGRSDLLAGVRGAPAERRMSFRGVGSTVDLEVSPTGTTRSLIGQLAPAVGSPTVVARSADGSTRDVEVDDLGRFVVDGLPACPVSLRVERDDSPPLHTDWVAL